jgi:hypothetical protein
MFNIIRSSKRNIYNILNILIFFPVYVNVLLARLTPYVSEDIWHHQCGFRRNRSTTDQIFYIRQILEKKMGV